MRFARQWGYDVPVRIHASDTDVWWILMLHFSALKDITVELMYGGGVKARLIDMWAIRDVLKYTDKQWEALVCFHVDSGVDNVAPSRLPHR